MPLAKPSCAAARAKSKPSRAVRSLTTARPSDIRCSTSPNVAARDQSGVQNSARESDSSEKAATPVPAPTVRVVKGKANASPRSCAWRRTAAEAKINVPSTVNAKSHGLGRDFPSNPVLAFAPPAFPGANCPTAPFSKLEEGSENSAARRVSRLASLSPCVTFMS